MGLLYGGSEPERSGELKFSLGRWMFKKATNNDVYVEAMNDLYNQYKTNPKELQNKIRTFYDNEPATKNESMLHRMIRLKHVKDILARGIDAILAGFLFRFIDKALPPLVDSHFGDKVDSDITSIVLTIALGLAIFFYLASWSKNLIEDYHRKILLHDVEVDVIERVLHDRNYLPNKSTVTDEP